MKKTKKKTASKRPALSKADWVRKHPNATPMDLAKKAATEGIKITPGRIASIRYSDRKASAKAAPKAPTTKQPSKTATTAKTATNGAVVKNDVASLKSIARRMGVASAIAVLQKIERIEREAAAKIAAL